MLVDGKFTLPVLIALAALTARDNVKQEQGLVVVEQKPVITEADTNDVDMAPAEDSEDSELDLSGLGPVYARGRMMRWNQNTHQCEEVDVTVFGDCNQTSAVMWKYGDHKEIRLF